MKKGHVMAPEHLRAIREAWDDPLLRVKSGAAQRAWRALARAEYAATHPAPDPIQTCRCGAIVVHGARRIGPDECSTCWAQRIESVMAQRRAPLLAAE